MTTRARDVASFTTTRETARGLRALAVPLGGQGCREAGRERGGKRGNNDGRWLGRPQHPPKHTYRHTYKHTYKLKSPRASGVYVGAGGTGASGVYVGAGGTGASMSDASSARQELNGGAPETERGQQIAGD